MKVEFATNVERTATYKSQIEAPKKREIEKVEVETKVKTEKVEKERESNVRADETKKIQEAVDKINKQLKSANTKIQFKIHDSDYSDINKVSIKIIDETNEEVIREIPSEEAIELSEKMHEVMGVLFDERK